MRVIVIGAGQMGHGIGGVAASADHTVVVNDVDEERVEAGLDGIEATLEGGIEHGKVTPAERDAPLDRLSGEVDLVAAARAHRPRRARHPARHRGVPPRGARRALRPPQLLRRKVRAGKLGKKSGEGFYVWADGERIRPVDEPADDTA